MKEMMETMKGCYNRKQRVYCLSYYQK